MSTLRVVGHGLVADVDVGEQRDEVGQQQQDQADRVDRDRPDQGEAEHAGEEDDRVPDLEPECCSAPWQSSSTQCGGPGPEQVDEQDGDELEQVQVEARPAHDRSPTGRTARPASSAASAPAAAPRISRANVARTRRGRIIADLSSGRGSSADDRLAAGCASGRPGSPAMSRGSSRLRGYQVGRSLIPLRAIFKLSTFGRDLEGRRPLDLLGRRRAAAGSR